MKIGRSEEEKFARLRKKMVETQIVARNIQDRGVIKQMLAIPRHLFVLREFIDMSYDDCALPIEENQTISQPYIVALMSQLLKVKKTHKVLEIGTGSGYQTAILANLAKSVHTIEIVPKLYQQAKKLLDMLGYVNVCFRLGDGTLGWREEAPFDRIIITAAPSSVPHYVIRQLKKGGRMLLPLGIYQQQLVCIDKKENGELTIEKGSRVRFVPMTGIAEQAN